MGATYQAPERPGAWLLAALLGGGTVGLGAAALTSHALGTAVGGPADGLPMPGCAAEPKETDLWDRWAQVKSFLGGWRSCGSFNPPTYLHLRMLELAQQALSKARAAGFDVLGAYMSPVNDAYWKQALAPGSHRVRMCQLATQESDSIMVDAWEVEQRQYTRTLYEPGASCPPVLPRVMLVCGADVLNSMADPAMWRQDLLETLLSRHGVVCITRSGSETAKVLDRPGTLLNAYRGNVAILQDPVPNEVSSSRVRHELEQGHSVRYLLPDAVINHVYRHGLYGTGGGRRPRLLSRGPKSCPRPVYVMDPQLGIIVSADDLATPPEFDTCTD
eukprot:scaffold1.g5479.t1